MAPRGAPALGTGLRYVLTVLAGMTLSMVIAFVAVRTLTRGTQFSMEANTREVSAAWALRNCANELTRLTNAFVDAVPVPSSTLTLGTRTWLAEQFQDEVDSLRRQAGAGELQDLSPSRALADACARLSSMALHPEDAGLRTAAMQEVRRAVDGANTYVREKGLERRVALPITPMRGQ